METKSRSRAFIDNIWVRVCESIIHFNANAIFRGMELAVVGAVRALQNPKLFTTEHYRSVALAVCAAIVIRLLITVPELVLRFIIWFMSLAVDFETSALDDKFVAWFHFLADSILQIPLFIMGLMRYIHPTLDTVFMSSLEWVDRTYRQRHISESPSKLRAMYFDNLRLYDANSHSAMTRTWFPISTSFIQRYVRRACISLAVYLATFIPYVGNYILPAASFYTFRKAVGTGPAVLVFAIGLVSPQRFLLKFLQAYFASRGLMRELMEPYFSRITFSYEQRRLFFRDREGVIFGFGLMFYFFLRVPLFGVLVYGIAEASTAFLISKLTDPPPPPEKSEGFAQSQTRWRNKHEFFRLSTFGPLSYHRLTESVPPEK